MNQTLKYFLGKPGSMRAHLVKSTTGVFMLQGTSVLLGFAISIILARLLGASNYGIYAYVWSITTFLSIFATFGLPQLLVRNIAMYRVKEEWSYMKGLLLFADRLVLTLSLGLIILLSLVGWFLSDRIDAQTIQSLFISLPLLIFMAFLKIKQMSLQGLDRIVQGQMLQAAIRPMAFLFLVGAVYFLFKKITLSLAIGLQVTAFGIACLTGVFLLRANLPETIRDSSVNFDKKTWVYSSLPLLLVMLLQIGNQNIDILMLGAMKGAASVGLYKVAFQITMVIGFTLQAVGIAIAPSISRLHTKNETTLLQKVITQGAMASFLISLPLGLIYILAGEWILTTLFGDEYVKSSAILIILTMSQFTNIVAGPSHQLLVMTNQENIVSKGWSIAVAINVLLNIILIPKWGIEGAAMATLISMGIWNILFAVCIYRNNGIIMSIFATIIKMFQKWRTER